MRKILYHIDSPHPGGAANQLRTLVRLIKRTFDQTYKGSDDKAKYEPVVTCGTYPELDEWVATLEQGYESEHNREAKRSRVIRLGFKNTRDPRALRLMNDVLISERPDLVHVHLSHSGSCRQALLACAKQKIPVVATEHDPFPLSLPKKLVKQQTLKVTDHTIALSNGTRDFLIKEYSLDPSTISIVHNGIDISDFQNVHPLDRSGFNIPNDHLIVTTVAELHERKGVRYLLKTIPDIVKAFPHVTFIIVGDGEEREKLEQMHTPNTLFFHYSPDVKTILAATDLYVLPSIREAFGLTVLEAFASLVPVIATETAGPTDIIQNEVTGLLVPPADPEALGDAIVHLLNHPDIRKKLAENAFKTLQQDFTADRMAQKTVQIYGKILG